MWPLVLRYWKPIGVVLLVAGVWLHGDYHGAGQVQGKWDQSVAEIAAANAVARADAERIQRTEEQRRADWAAGIQRDATQALEKVRTDADGAIADAQRLRGELAKLQARLSGTSKNPAAPVSSASATRAAMVLSELYGSCQSRLTELSSAFDRARIAGLACESAYDGLTGHVRLP